MPESKFPLIQTAYMAMILIISVSFLISLTYLYFNFYQPLIASQNLMLKKDEIIIDIDKRNIKQVVASMDSKIKKIDLSNMGLNLIKKHEKIELND
jgi:hypothetical protein